MIKLNLNDLGFNDMKRGRQLNYLLDADIGTLNGDILSSLIDLHVRHHLPKSTTRLNIILDNCR